MVIRLLLVKPSVVTPTISSTNNNDGISSTNNPPPTVVLWNISKIKQSPIKQQMDKRKECCMLVHTRT